MGWQHADIGHQAIDQDAARPLDVDGDSLVWRVGVLWSRCPRWHAEHSPYSKAAGRLVSTIDRSRNGVESPPVWTAAGAALADTAQSLRSWLESDRIAKAHKK